MVIAGASPRSSRGESGIRVRIPGTGSQLPPDIPHGGPAVLQEDFQGRGFVSRVEVLPIGTPNKIFGQKNLRVYDSPGTNLVLSV